MKFNEFINEARVVPGSKKDLENIKDFAERLRKDIHNFGVICSDFIWNSKNEELTDAYKKYRKYDTDLEDNLNKLIFIMKKIINQ